ncbi:flagellar hook-length control protein FliK [Candidatus Enterovibrio escicola]|uniref:flagellar hook-length control protein FliK n=1 Tax=Candidatus Enterovibrio escicola TaxID=1927127 RepID=UPI001CC2C590|nr:flagellar hook-length control protein FliK [Candidatus Enterovibrio escacola]
MNSISFLLTDLPTRKTSFDETKGLLFSDVLSSDDKVFFAQLMQLVSGNGEVRSVSPKGVSASKDVASKKISSGEFRQNMFLSEKGGERTLLTTADVDTENIGLNTGKNMSTTAAEIEVLAMTFHTENGKDMNVNSMLKSHTKEEGEVLLRRLNKENTVLQNMDYKPAKSRIHVALEGKRFKGCQGKGLPFLGKIESSLGKATVQVAQHIVADHNFDFIPQVQQQSISNAPKMKRQIEGTILLKNVSDDDLSVLAYAVSQISSDEEISGRMYEPVLPSQVDVPSDPNEKLISSLQTEVQHSDNVEELTTIESLLTSATITLLYPQIKPLPALVEGKTNTEQFIKINFDQEWVGKASQKSQMQDAVKVILPFIIEGDALTPINELTTQGLTPPAQAIMSEASAVVYTAITPQAQQTIEILESCAIPFPISTMKVNHQPRQLAVSVLSSTQQLGEVKQIVSGVKAEHLVQQLASSFGNLGLITSAKLDSLVTPTAIQMNQNQDEVADILSERINRMLAKNLKLVDIRLDPPELGRIQIKLSMNQDQASVQFTVLNQQVKELVEQTIPRLRDMLQQQGLQLTQSSVQHQDAVDRQGFSENQSSPSSGKKDQQKGLRSIHGDDEQDTDLTRMNHDSDVKVSKVRVDYYA